MLAIDFKVGDRVSVLYPKHGKRNILRSIEGDCVRRGQSANGDYLTVKYQENNEDVYRSLLFSKIVVLKR